MHRFCDIYSPLKSTATLNQQWLNYFTYLLVTLLVSFGRCLG